MMHDASKIFVWVLQPKERALRSCSVSVQPMRPQLMSPFPVLEVVTGVCIVILQNSMHCAAKLADQVLLEVQVGSDVHTGGEDVVARLTVIAMVVRMNLFYANR